ncbi:uncharacterized protein TM35_000381310 [Trypanosoma theileri]|uniref:Sperm-tail PG-rich repeat n=1 Tax=Trypanosoma theileri TaxID=67003 RepID=A0A1X0NK50_9TRYP|nr:uncharacterized protein TM35_000381310 [Trypanosoma theileri]ORC85056.1 hypothetical protein TM35_000381310 [Trypanosoma theileri]
MDLYPERDGVDPEDLQAQVDQLYSHILASVDVSLDDDVDNSRRSFSSRRSMTVGGSMEVKQRSQQTVSLATERRSKLLMRGVSEGTKFVSVPDCSCGEGGEKISFSADLTTSTKAAAEVRDEGEGCLCSCHHSPLCCAAHHPLHAVKEKNSSSSFSKHMSKTILRPGAAGVLPQSLRRQPPSTFGSGRKGMSEPVKKNSTPGPGSYFWNDDHELHVKSSSSVHRTLSGRGDGSGGRQETQKVSSMKEDSLEVLKRQFSLTCQCYWKEFPDIEIPTNPSAHAVNCPYQHIRTTSIKSSDSSRSSQSSYSENSFPEVNNNNNNNNNNNRKHRSNAAPVVVSPRRGVCNSTKKVRGAVFGTSPRRTIFAEQHLLQQSENTLNESGKPTSREGAKSMEKNENIPKNRKNSSLRNLTPSRQLQLGEVDTVPGPGAYNVSSAFDVVAKKDKTRGVSIGRAARKLHTMTESPGPGAYYTDTTGGKDDQSKKKNYFLTSSPRRLQLSATTKEETGPGPCEYSTEKTILTDARHKNAPAFSFGRAKLPECAKTLFRASPAEKVDDIPGPGTYDISTVSHETGGAPVSGRTAIITTARRNDDMWRGVYYKPDDIPGPGTYTVAKEERGPAYSLGTRPTEYTEPTPGPGQYMIPDESSGPQWTMSARRSSPNIKEPSPGPGEYFVPIYDLRREHSKAPLFTTAPRLLHDDTNEAAKNPGPGNYDITSTMDAARTVVMGTAERTTNLEGESSEIPGPGSYMVQHSTQERRIAVPILGTSSPRFESETVSGSVNPNLGPGYYDLDAQSKLMNQRSAVLGSAPRTSSFIPQDMTTDAGPGSYEIVVPKDGPFFSIGQRLPDNTAEKEITPGPGVYDVQELTTGRSAVVGSAARFQPSEEEKASNEVPGPGAYTTVVPPISSSPAVIFGTSPRMLEPEGNGENNYSKNNLGPGNYDPQDIRGNIPGAAWGTSLRFTEENGQKEIPGPGAYEILSQSPVQNIIFGTAGEKSNWLVPTGVADQPGPGSYIPQDPKERGTSTVVFGSSPQHMLSPEERENLIKTNLGPGTYDAKIQTPHAFHATFGNTKVGRIEEMPIDPIPGPGQYSPENVNNPSSRTVVFGTASRNQLQTEGNDIPGPGAYEPMDTSNTGVQSGPVTFSTAVRFDSPELVKGNNGNKGDTPGPGAYSLERYMESTTSGGAVIIGTGPRILDHEQRERAQLPGPGQYTPLDTVTMAKTSVYTFSTEPRMAVNGGNGYNSNTNAPGPGAYDVAVPTFTAPTTRFGTEERKLEPSTLEEIPGPGTYDVNTAVRAISSTGPSYLFPTAPRELPANSSDTPGPGQYEGNLVETFLGGDTKAPSFPTGPRFSEVKNNNLLPGPGQYTPSHPQWEASKVYSFSTGGKQPLNGDEVDFPGPGTYSPNQILPSSGAPIFGTEPRRIGLSADDLGNVDNGTSNKNNNNNNNPGPGYYNVTLPPSGPAVSFGVATREIMQNKNDEGAPGPGTYDVVSRVPEGPVFSMHRTAPRGTSLAEMENSQIPGPGAYSVPPVFPATEGVGAAISFVKAERFQVPDSAQEGTPGPGFYSPQYFDQATGCFIARAPRLAEVNDGSGKIDIPGPGHYEVNRHDNIFDTTVNGGVAMRFTASRFSGNGEGNTSDIPGPASYNISETTNAGTTISFPQAPRFVVSELKNAAMQPGPGEYSIPSSLHPSMGAVAHSFGTSTRMESPTDAVNTPGPGSYDASRYAARFMSGPAFTLQGKPTYIDEKETVDYPGPGAYCPRPVETVRTTSFGVPTTVDPDAVFAAHVNSTPGPGTYVIPPTLSQQTVTFGTAGRMTEVKEDLPGPGAYLTSGPVIIPSQPAFSFGNAPRPDIVPSTQYDLPGPGEYHHPIDPKPSVPVFTFTGAERFNDMETLGGIGPGQYYNLGSAGSQDGRVYTFPTALRTVTGTTPTSTGNIGPGEYFHPHRWELAERGPTFPPQNISPSTNKKR